jgi:L-asparagine oxygenase
LNTIYFHKDLANHFVRLDWVNILGLRASPFNEILTSFVRNKDLLEALSTETKDILSQEIFYTPFDDLTALSRYKKLGKAPSTEFSAGQHTTISASSKIAPWGLPIRRASGL